MYAERIERMRAEGLLTAAQADALQASLASLQPEPERRPHRALSIPRIIVIVCVALVLLVSAFLIMSPPDTDPTAAEIHDVSQMLNVPGGTGAMNRSLSTLGSMALLSLPLVLVIVAFAWFYNRIVDHEERVYEAWSQVESNLQRRTDLIPSLVETVSRYMKHERETLTGVTDERADALNPLADALDQLIADQQRARSESGEPALDDEDALARLAQAQQTLAGSLRSFIAVAESYPNLRSGDQFLSLQAQLEGTENRINVARMEFNQSVGDYNSAIRRLPGSMIAGLGHFKRKAYFKTEGDAGRPVELEFDQN